MKHVALILLVTLAGCGKPTPEQEWQRLSLEEQKTRISIKSLGVALDLYNRDTKSYPETLEGLMKDPGNIPGWAGPYMKRNVPPDGWGQDYFYEMEVDGHDVKTFKLWSAGPNKKSEDGAQDSDDIVYSDF